MNKLRRESIQQVITDLENLRETINNLWDEEQDAFDNLPEGLQETERGETIQDTAYKLSDIYDTIDSILNDLECASTDLYDLT